MHEPLPLLSALAEQLYLACRNVRSAAPIGWEVFAGLLAGDTAGLPTPAAPA
jgi:hypothetical protein